MIPTKLHGTYKGYLQGCKCDPCRAARRAYSRHVRNVPVRLPHGEEARDLLREMLTIIHSPTIHREMEQL